MKFHLVDWKILSCTDTFAQFTGEYLFFSPDSFANSTRHQAGFFPIQASSSVKQVFLPWIHLCNSIGLHQGYMCATEVIYGRQLGWRDLTVDTNRPLEYFLLLMMWKKAKNGEVGKWAKPLPFSCIICEFYANNRKTINAEI